MHMIVKSFKENEASHKVEMRISNGLLEMANKRAFNMEKSLNQAQDSSRRANQKMEEMDMLIKFKDQKIKELVEELENGHIKQELIRLSGRIEILKKQAQMEREAKEKLEENLSKIDVSAPESTNETDLDQKTEKCWTEMRLEKKLVQDQDARIRLLEDQVAEQTKTTQFLNNIIIEKDKTVIRLQSQVSEYLSHDISSVIGCIENDTLITAQYEALANFTGFAMNQDRYRQAKDSALRILQNTVYEMVDQIPTCRDRALDGMKREIEALTMNREPLEIDMDQLQTSLNRALELHKKGQKSIIENMNKIITRQKKALDICKNINEVDVKTANLTGLQSQRGRQSIEEMPRENEVQIPHQIVAQSHRVEQEPAESGAINQSVGRSADPEARPATREESHTDTDSPAVSSVDTGKLYG